ncbi:hypothetical protein GCM10023200_27430 [Actinomycetospora chlora]|uniref:Sigma 54 modulation/S30EA ribosomal protein C-terminal domain-containing protein n=1 Tax=Actinomycetospora chlora TaxID=663608 RepID=A0ABP9B6X2_9PSEU
MTPRTTPAPSRLAPPVVEIRGTIARDLPEYTRDKVLAALDHGVRPTGPARVRIVRHDDPARERPVVASAHVDLAGVRLHVHVVGATPREAVDLLVDRLRRRVGDVHARRQPRHDGPAGARAPEPVVDRHDVVQAVPTSVADAVAVMDARDEAFHLFVERTTGRRAVVYRCGPAGHRLALEDGSAPPAAERAGITVSPVPARAASPEEAVEHLRLGGWPFLFFRDRAGGRARVVHLDDRGRAVLVDVEADGPRTAS